MLTGSEPSKAITLKNKAMRDMSHDSIEDRLSKIEKEHREMYRDLIDIRCKVLNLEPTVETIKKRILELDDALEKIEKDGR